ncbi:MAG: threonine/serine exporter family protein [Eubacteriales bacterium]|nr:threonine/serine exporter family protein [Eubacteriales bacterium]
MSIQKEEEEKKNRELKGNKVEAILAQFSVAGSRRIASLILDIGEMILRSGGEVARVEDTINRLCSAYGFRKTDVFTISSCIIMTVTDEGGNIFTQTRRIRGGTGTDMERVRRCNALSRELCAHPLPEAELRKSVEALSGTPVYSNMFLCLGYICIAGSMAVFFGGDRADFIAAAVAAPVMLLVMELGRRADIQNYVTYFLNAFITGLLIYALLRFGIGHNYDKIAMGCIMILISGVALTTAIRDMINGDVVTGLLGLINALIQAVVIALGFVAAFAIFER